MPETVVHFQIRMPPAIHEHLASRAKDEKTSLNALVVAMLREALENREKAGGATIVPTPTAAPAR